MKLAFFDAKPYDRPGFDAHAAGTGLEIRYFETKLGEDTVQLSRGFDGVCVFIHYSSANIREKSFLECLQQPLFKLYRKGQPFNGNHLRPCPMLENPELLPKMVAQSGAHSTDLEAPESAEHLCEKCKSYAECWKPTAETLWSNSHPTP